MEERWKDYYSWSRSKQSMFDECPRKYFYRYVAYYNVPFGNDLKSLKNLIESMYNYNFMLGTIVHAAIERQFDQISRGREVHGSDPALSYIIRTIDEIKNHKKRYIIEALNGQSISDQDIIDLGKEAQKQVKIFFSEFFDFYKNLEIIEHEKYSNIELEGHRFYVVPDLVTRSLDGRIYITEWKSNSNYKDAIDPYQMKLYILWALKERLAELDKLRAEIIFLDIGKSEEYKVSNEDIEKFKEEIVDKSKKLYECIDCKSSKEEFNKCEKKENCISCGYNQYCKLN